MRSACYAALALGFLFAQSATADPIHYSTSGQFEHSKGTLDLIGVSNAPADAWLPLGSIAVTGGETTGSTPFHVHFEFNGALPSIDVSGAIGWVGYNSNEFIENPVVTTSATAAQFSLYPIIFQDMLAHPDWIRTTSYASDSPTTHISMSVAPYDPNEVKTVPEPSTALLFVVGAVGLTGWSHQRRKN